MSAQFDREAFIRQLFTDALDRVIKNEDPDPCMAVVAALCQGKEVKDEDIELIVDTHHYGSWTTESDRDLQIFTHWCNEIGISLNVGKPIDVNGVNLYVDNHGDCMLAESAAGRNFAMWTRKGRLYIGFRDKKTAEIFRSKEACFSMKTTGNKLTKLVVVEGGDNPETITKTSRILKYI